MIREVKKRSGSETNFEQDLRGIDLSKEKIGPFGLLTVHNALAERGVAEAAAQFSCKIQRKNPSGIIEVVTPLQEVGSHKVQVLRLFAVAALLAHRDPNCAMVLATPRFNELYSFKTDGHHILSLTDETFHILNQSGLNIAELQLSAAALEQLVRGQVVSAEDAERNKKHA